MADRNFASNKLYQFHVMSALVDCNFVVDRANANGLGVSSIKGGGVKQVYMHTSASPASGNPNPADGLIVVKLSDNYSGLFAKWESIVGPNGASSTSSVANVANIITVLGTATLAQWQAVGLPVGITPAIGVSFIATSSALIGGAAQVAIALAAGSGIDHIELVGQPNADIAPSGAATPSGLNGKGAMFILRCYKNGVLTQPTDGSVISLSFYLSNSSVLINGE